tara:strand:- start:689 stop:1213 length:525 start_codon:yes stop_codon:yes gene_type:complete
MNRELINKLTKDDAKWRNVAYKICGDYDVAQDLVQEMYLKFSKDTYNDYTDVTDYLAALVIRNEYMRGMKKNYTSAGDNKEVRLPEGFDIADEVSEFEVEDEHLGYIERFNELPMRQQELILESYDYSIREIADRFNINFMYVQRQIHKGLKYVLGNEYDKYNNSNLKYKKNDN